MKSDFKRNLSIIVGISLSVKILGLLYRFILARLLQIEGMTIFSLLAPTLSLALCLSSLSIPSVVNQKVSQSTANITYSNRGLIKSAFKITIISSSIISIIILVFGSFISTKLLKNENLYIPLLITIPLIYLSNFSGVFKGYLEAHRLFKVTAKSSLFEQIFKIIVSIILVVLLSKKGIMPAVIGAIVGLMLSEVVSFTYLLFKVSKITKLNYKNIEDKYKREILNQATPLTINHLIFSLVSFVEPILFTYSLSFLGYDSTESQRFFALVTAYAFPILTMAFFASFSIAKAIFPYISANKDNNEENCLLIKKSLIFCLAVGIVNFNLMFFFPSTILNLLYKNTESATIVRILSPFYLIYYFSPVYVTAIQAMGLEKNLLKNNIISHIFELILIYILCQIPKINMYGIVLALGICFITSQLLHYLTLYKKINFRIRLNDIMNFIIFVSFNMFITHLLTKFTLDIINMIISNTISVLIVYYYYKYKNKSDKKRSLTKQKSVL